MAIYDNYNYNKLEATDVNIVRIGSLSLTPAGIETGGTLVSWSDLQDDSKMVRLALSFTESQLRAINIYIAEHCLASTFKVIMFDGLSNSPYVMTDSKVVTDWQADNQELTLLDFIYDHYDFGTQQIPCLAFIPAHLTSSLKYSREIRKDGKRGSRGRRKPSNIKLG